MVRNLAFSLFLLYEYHIKKYDLKLYMDDIKSHQNRLKEGYGLPLYEPNELKYIKKPIGSALYKRARGRPKKDDNIKAKPNDRVRCKICGNFYTRSGKYNHEITKVCQVYARLDKNMKKIIFNDD